MTINLLAIESSCDDTSASVIQNGIILSNVTANQEVHAKYGGVVPELASRKHQQNIVPVVDQALKKAGITTSDLNGIAFTKGPGLLGSLIVGVSFAKSLAMSLEIPMIEVHHMHAHVLALFAKDPKPKFPLLCLTVSGGHTQIVLVKDYLDMEVVGSTIDDAAGEAFDKTGKILGLPYPAGPHIDKLAQLGEPKYTFTEPNIEGLNFSFSGLKTSILYFLQKKMKEDPSFVENEKANICASVQERIISILLNKLQKASLQYNIKEIGIAGGVSANSGLRQSLKNLGKDLGWNTYIPEFQFCTDNAGMIAIAGYQKFLKSEFSDQTVQATARLHF